MTHNHQKLAIRNVQSIYMVTIYYGLEYTLSATEHRGYELYLCILIIYFTATLLRLVTQIL